ncbi:MAG: hypothetical protein ACQETB_11030 [Halobacteriota archaeon]
MDRLEVASSSSGSLTVLLFVIGIGSLLLLGGITGTVTAETTAPTCSDVELSLTDSRYEVENVTQMQCIGNESTGVGLDDDYVLVNDIDASETEDWFDGAGFEPIGSASTSSLFSRRAIPSESIGSSIVQ